MASPQPGTDAWHDLVQEEILDPDRPIVDPHHHLWETHSMWGVYTLEDLWNDTESGHNIQKTVFIDCHSNYLTNGPDHLKPIGETEYVALVAAESAETDNKATIAAIVSHANMQLGEGIEEVLAAHEEAGNGLFRGIRHAGPHDTSGTLRNPGSPRPCPYSDEDFRTGVRTLGELGYTYDTWHFFMQNQDYLSLAMACPETTMILDHFGTPLGVGAYANQQEEIFAQWQKDVAAIAECPNVFAKLGGLAMPDNGFGWHERERPPSSDEFVEAQKPYFMHMIECFGPERCMFESNYPVDKLSVSYHVLWNAFKKLTADFSDDEKNAMFHDTASQIYRI
ncbi:MAG: amidohydrolase family protein [Pseudomonadota bacterium]|nr:amidohydrolase family protein [Pseudomonadota bacterium]